MSDPRFNKVITVTDVVNGVTVRRCKECKAPLFEVLGRGKTKPLHPHMEYCPLKKRTS